MTDVPTVRPHQWVSMTAIEPLRAGPSRKRPINRQTVEALKESIGRIGLRTPITVRDLGDGLDYRIVAGAHRFIACKELGHTHIPAVEADGTEEDDELWEIDENAVREDLTPDQRADHLERRRAIIDAALLATANDRKPKSDRTIAGELGIKDHKAVSRRRAALEAGGAMPHHQTRVGRDGVAQPATKPRSVDEQWCQRSGCGHKFSGGAPAGWVRGSIPPALAYSYLTTENVWLCPSHVTELHVRMANDSPDNRYHEGTDYRAVRQRAPVGEAEAEDTPTAASTCKPVMLRPATLTPLEAEIFAASDALFIAEHEPRTLHEQLRKVRRHLNAAVQLICGRDGSVASA